MEQEERFWSKVNKTDLCWLWTSTIARETEREKREAIIDQLCDDEGLFERRPHRSRNLVLNLCDCARRAWRAVVRGDEDR